MQRTDTPPDPLTDLAFELERFEWTEDRLEVVGRWFGVRGHRFIRPTLHLKLGDRRQRLIALLDDKPWAADGEGAWTAAFAWTGAHEGVTAARLEVAPDVILDLPSPGEDAAGASLTPRARPRRPARKPTAPRRAKPPAEAEPPKPAAKRRTKPAAKAEPSKPAPKRRVKPAATVPQPAAIAEPQAAASATPVEPASSPPATAASPPPAATPAPVEPASPPPATAASPPPAATPAPVEPASPPPAAAAPAEPASPPPAAAAPVEPASPPPAAARVEPASSPAAAAPVEPASPPPAAEPPAPPLPPAYAPSSMAAEIATLALERRLVEERAERERLGEELDAARREIASLSAHHASAVERSREVVELEGQLAAANARAEAAESRVAQLERDVTPLPPRIERRRDSQDWSTATQAAAIAAVALVLVVLVLIIL